MIRYVLFFLLIFISSSSFANELPVGVFESDGFIIKKGSMKITDKDMFIHKGSLEIKKIAKDTYNFTISAHIQKQAGTSPIINKRTDTLSVVWDTDKKGKLLNKSPLYKKDISSFEIKGKHLIIKSWIHRNQLWETHIYLLKNK